MRLNEFGYIAVKDAVSVQPTPAEFRKDMAGICRSIQASLVSLTVMLQMLADDRGDASSTELDLSSSGNASDLTL